MVLFLPEDSLNGEGFVMSSRPTKNASTIEVRDNPEVLLGFFAKELPPEMTNEALYFTDAVLDAGARYDRYSRSKSEWLDLSLS
jgi:hypothetical protein